jgi:hypothetical protein
MNHDLLPRHLVRPLERRLEVMPAVVVTGARQTGKSTLVRELLRSDRTWFTLDDLDTLEAARRDPAIITDALDPVTIDEVQREPRLLIALKSAIDRERVPGRYLITGSANLLLMQNVSESLAGRAAYLVLRPLTRGEQAGNASCGAWESLLSEREERWIDLLTARASAEEDWRALALRGGFPTPSVHMHRPDDRSIWFDGYIRTYLERDLQQLSSISALPDFRRLMRASCLRIGQVINQTDLGRDVGLPQPTVHRYLNLLEVSHLLVRLPAYSVNRTSRLIKSPKLYWGDTGLALHLAGSPEPGGPHLENLVLNDLMAWGDSSTKRADIHYWRTTNSVEIDFVVEYGSEVLPIEVKASAGVRLGDARALRRFRQEYADVSRAGLLIHAGRDLRWIAPDVLAAPWWMVM